MSVTLASMVGAQLYGLPSRASLFSQPFPEMEARVKGVSVTAAAAAAGVHTHVCGLLTGFRPVSG
jgi:hypothetical protein